MEAIILATGVVEGMEAVQETRCHHLVPLVDRPFLQHIVEQLIDEGVTDFHFVLSHLPEQVEALLGDGTRWGSRFVYHLVREPARAYDHLSLIPLREPGAALMLVHADCIVEQPAIHSGGAPVLIYASGDDAGVGGKWWTGWARVPGAWIVDLPRGLDRAALEAHLADRARATGSDAGLAAVGRTLSLRALPAILEAQRAVLEGRFTTSALTGREREDGVRVGHGATIRAGAKLIPPVFIGERCYVGPDAVVGPGAIIGQGSVVERGSQVSNTLVFPGSYIGRGLALKDALVDGSRLIGVASGGRADLTGTYLLDRLMDASRAGALRRLLGRGVAGLLFLITLPVQILTCAWLMATREGPVLHVRECLRLPASEDPAAWRTYPHASLDPDPDGADQGLLQHLLLRWLPGLLMVARGDLDPIGVRPRSASEVEDLPEHWRSLYLSARGGLVTEDFARGGAALSAEERQAFESYYAVATDWRHDLRILAALLGRMGGGRAPSLEAGAQGAAPVSRAEPRRRLM